MGINASKDDAIIWRVQRMETSDPAERNRQAAVWDTFAQNAKNTTFLLQRNFMDYHAHKFQDHSLFIYADNQLQALLPAHQIDQNLYSHQGLTYGGLILPFDIKLQRVIHIWKVIRDYMSTHQLKNLYYKACPSFYCRQSNEEEQYCMFLMNAQIYRVDTAFVTKTQAPIQLQQRRRRAIQKAKKLGVQIQQAPNCTDFWDKILTPNLLQRFGVAPVHSLQEIELLRQRFPSNILQFNAYLNGEILAGTTIFSTDTTAHAQYISASPEGRDTGAIDLLFAELIQVHFAHLPYFSFGIANENQGRSLNQGLVDWKEGFGTEIFSQPFYLVPSMLVPSNPNIHNP